jgi:hypothetical protein
MFRFQVYVRLLSFSSSKPYDVALNSGYLYLYVESEEQW